MSSPSTNLNQSQPVTAPSTGMQKTDDSTGQASQNVSLLPGLNTLIIGPTGTGKTHSIGTAVDYGQSRGLEVFVLMLESGLESLLGYWTDRGLAVPDNLHWFELERTGSSFENLAGVAQLLTQYTLDVVFKMPDNNKAKYNEFERFLRQLANFQDSRTGKSYGPVDSWGPDKMLVIDGLTGVCDFAMSCVIGGKALRDQRDWGVAQEQVARLIRQLCDGPSCHFTLLGHVERETDPVFGGVKIMPAALGKALPPKLAPMFSDTILSERVATTWTWSTANAMADLKTRNLPIADKISQDFSQMFKKWESRGGRFTAKTVKKK